MKIVHPHIDKQIDFYKSDVYILIIENPQEFYNLSKQIISQFNGEEGEWILSQTFPIEINKNVLVLYDFFNLTCNNKKLENLLKNYLLGLNKDLDCFDILSKINKDLIEFNDFIINNVDFKITAKDEISFEEVLKISKFSFKDDDNILENILNYVEVYSKLTSLKVVVMIGITDILGENDIEKLIKDFIYRDIKILFIESNDKNILREVNKIIIDKDLCVI